MGKAFGWLAALGLGFGAASGACAEALPLILAPPMRVEASPSVSPLPSVGAPPPVSLRFSGSEGSEILNQQPEPATLMLLATGLAGLVVLGHREFV